MQKSVILFPGQSAQYVGMGKKLCERYDIANETFKEANEVLGFDLQELCFKGSMEDLTKTENTQPAVLVTSVAAFRAYMMEIGVKPSIMVGHSLGEITALTCSGAISYKDAVKLSKLRGKYMQEAVEIGVGSMAAIVGMDKYLIEEFCNNMSNDEQIVSVANYNTSEQTVISGYTEKVDEVADYFKKLGAKTVKLKVSAPFHCALMQTAADKFNRELKKYTFTPMNIPVVSNVSATLYCSENQIIENLTNQIVKPVQWQKSMENLSLQGINTIVDIGPKKILKNFSNSILPSVKAYGFDDINDCEALVEWSKKVKRNSTPTYNVLTRCMAVAVCTKNNNWNNDEYREGVITPYQEIKLMQDEIEKEGKLPTDEQCKRGLQLLQTIFDTKKTSYEEQSSRIAQILEETNKELLGTEVMKKYNLN